MKALNWLVMAKKLQFSWNVRSYCTKASASTADTLLKRILPIGDDGVSIVSILDGWVQEGRPVNQSDLRIILKSLRNQRRYTHALQMVEWAAKDSTLSPEDVAIRLDLIVRAHGLEEAERYLSSVPHALKTFKVIGSLLNCYAYGRMLEKAEATMQLMKSFDCNLGLSYNVMLNLYIKLGKRDKFRILVQEMENNGIKFHRATVCILLNAYATDPDIETMEKILEKMKNDRLVKLNWNICCIVAKGYLNAGLTGKASDMLKKAEKLIGWDRDNAYNFLLTMYASLGDNDKVVRIWDIYKKRGNVGNNGYFYMICSLIRLDNIKEAEKIFREWESANTSYDFRLPNSLINAYTKKGLMPKAEALVSRIADSGKKIPASTWDLLATGYYKDDQMDKAVDTMKKAICCPGHHEWALNRLTLIACLQHLKQNGGAEEFVKLLEDRGIFIEDNRKGADGKVGLDSGSVGARTAGVGFSLPKASVFPRPAYSNVFFRNLRN